MSSGKPSRDDEFNWNQREADAVLQIGMAVGSAQAYMGRTGQPARHRPWSKKDKMWWPTAKTHLHQNVELLDSCALWYQAVYLMSQKQVTDVAILVRLEWLEWFVDYTTSHNVLIACLRLSNYKVGLKEVLLGDKQHDYGSPGAYLDERAAAVLSRVVVRSMDMLAFKRNLNQAQQLDSESKS